MRDYDALINAVHENLIIRIAGDDLISGEIQERYAARARLFESNRVSVL